MKTLFSSFDKFQKFTFERKLSELASNQQSLIAYRNGEITINQLFRRVNIELFAYRFDFAVINNVDRSGKIESGKLIKLDGNYSFESTIAYRGNSFVNVYKRVFVMPNGNRIVWHRVWDSFEFKNKQHSIADLFDLDLISLFYKDKSTRSKIVKLIKVLFSYRFAEMDVRDFFKNFIKE